MEVKNDLFDYENRYIFQNSDFFKFSLDSILLAEFVDKTRVYKNIVDLCAGNMAIPLILSKYINTSMVGFEIQSDIYKLGKKSIEYNELTDQLSIINDDVKNIGNYYPKKYFDLMVCNPPYFKYTNNKMLNENEKLKFARHEITLNLEDIFLLANKFLSNNGLLYIVHRSERIDEIIYLGYKYKVNVKKIQFISTKNGKSPKIVLVKCVSGSKPGVKLSKEMCIENVNTYQNIFMEE